MPAGAGACQASVPARKSGHVPQARLGQEGGRLTIPCTIDTLTLPLYSSVLPWAAQEILGFSGARNLERKPLPSLPVTYTFWAKLRTLVSVDPADRHQTNTLGAASQCRGAHVQDVDKKRKANRLGALAGRAAVMVLRLKGYHILAFRFRVRGGEIDIIARRASAIAFVEVKVRPTLDEARSAIGAVKRRRISRAARTWLAANPWAAHLTFRGDAIFAAPWRCPRHEIAVIDLDTLDSRG
jgi:putative endonuclease